MAAWQVNHHQSIEGQQQRNVHVQALQILRRHDTRNPSVSPPPVRAVTQWLETRVALLYEMLLKNPKHYCITNKNVTLAAQLCGKRMIRHLLTELLNNVSLGKDPTCIKYVINAKRKGRSFYWTLNLIVKLDLNLSCTYSDCVLKCKLWLHCNVWHGSIIFSAS